MHHQNDCCDHTSCTSTCANASVHQTLSEMDWERGLWYAAFNGDTERIKTLIDKSRNASMAVNAPDNSGYTPLHYAARKGHVQICKMLLQYGADVNAQTRTGKATPLHKAAASGNMETVLFLIKSGATIDMQDVDGQSALHKAIQNKHYGLTNILVDACPRITSLKDNKDLLPKDYMPSSEDH